MKENIVQNEQEDNEESYGFTKSFTYTAIAICIVVSSIAFYSSYTYKTEVQKVNTQLTQQKESTGAKIEYILNKIAENKKQWSEIEANQEKLNNSTEKAEQELEKFNISVIQ